MSAIRSLFGLVVLSTVVLCSGCCAMRTRGRILGHLEAYGIIGFDKPSCCPDPRNDRVLRQIKVAEQLPVWVRLVRADRLNLPLAGRSVAFEVVDATGALETGATVSPSAIQTNADGYGLLPLLFKSDKPGVFKIRATYPEKRTSAVSYSPPIQVTQF